MMRILLILTLLLIAAHPVLAIHPRHTYVTPDELQGFGDFDADGRLDVLIVDRASGLYRVGLGQSDGTLLWQSAKSSGCPGADAIAVGPISSSTDSVAITGRSANRIHLIDPLAPYSRPTTLTPDGIGPGSLAVLDIALPGNDPMLMDLVSSTSWNSPPVTSRRQIHQSLSTGIAPAGTLFAGSIGLDRLSRVQLDTSGPEHLLTLRRSATDELRISDSTHSTLPALVSLSSLPPGTDFVHAPFSSTSPRSQFVLFVPGSPGISVASWTGVALTPPVIKSIGPDPVRSVHLISISSRIGFAVIYNDGTHADLFHLGSSGNPVLDGTVSPPNGEKLKGILGYAAGRLTALSGPAEGSSTTTTPYHHDGSDWIAGVSESLPGLISGSAGANVFLYDKEPFVDADAKLVETLHVPDWTTQFSIGLSAGSGPNTLRLTVETFDGEAGGLRNSVITSIPGLPAATSTPRALLNQSLPQSSISSTSTSLGTTPLQISITPPAGSYTGYVTPRLVVPDGTGITAYYRTSLSDIWSPYAFGSDIIPPGGTLSSFSVWYYAEDSSRRSAVYRADYAFSGGPGGLDSDADGVPDFVELQSGLDPLSGADTDEDGLTDLEELLLGSDPANDAEVATYGGQTLSLPPSRSADQDEDGFSDFEEWASGSDPFRASSTPSTSSLVEYLNSFDLNLRPLSHSGIIGASPDRESFPGSDPTFSPTEIHAHDLTGRLLGSATTGNHPGSILAQPYAHFPSLSATSRDLFVIASTPPTFDCEQVDNLPGWGRELIGLIPVPALNREPVPFIATTSSTAGDWISAARSHYASSSHAETSREMTLYDTLIYLLWEKIVDLKLKERPGPDDDRPLSFCGFRELVPDASRTASVGELLSLQTYRDDDDPGYLLQQLFETIRSEIESPTAPSTSALRQLANEIYRISAARTGTTPGLYPSPFETLRSVIRQLSPTSDSVDGTISLPGEGNNPTSYAAAHTLNAAALNRADSALVHLLSLIPSRTTQTFTATITSTSFSGVVPVLESESSPAGLRLYDAKGEPFVFPQSFDLPPGTTLEILAFTDRSDLPTGTGNAVEAISATITGFPSGTNGDLNQNAIDDEFEHHFLGGPVDPFGDADMDGYINLQEALDGTNPADPSSSPAGAPLPATLPPVRITSGGGQLHFALKFPSNYGSQIHFILQSAGGTLSAPFHESTNAANDAGLNTYTLSIPHPGTHRSFYRFRLALRP